MAEIYKQQVDYSASGGTMLKSAPFKNYYKKSMEDIEEGFRTLDQELQELGNKELAAKMDRVVQEADNLVENWQDFNTDGRKSLETKLSSMWDEALVEAPLSAQKRFASANPEAKKIFELKYKEKALKKANEQIFEAKKRTIGDISLQISRIENPSELIKAYETAINDKILYDPDNLLTVTQRGYLGDSFAHDTGKRAVLQAMINGRLEDAEMLMSYPKFAGTFGPDEYNSLQEAWISLDKKRQELAAEGGNYKEVGAALFDARDYLQMKYRGTIPPEEIDASFEKMLTAWSNGKPFSDVYLSSMPIADVLNEYDDKLLAYMDSIRPSTVQLGINSYHEKMKNVFPDYSLLQDEIGTKFVDQVSAMKIKDANGDIDVTKITPEQYSKLSKMTSDAKSVAYGMDSALKEEVNQVDKALRRQDDRVGKTYDASQWWRQEKRSGFWHWLAGEAEYVGMGNIPDAMVRRMESGEKPSFVQTFATAAADEISSGEYAADFAYDMQQTVAPTIKEAGDGDVADMPTNSYRFMTYLIPAVFAGVSVYGNEEDFKETGIKPGLITKDNAKDLMRALQEYYINHGINLDDPVDTYNVRGEVPVVPEQYDRSTSSPELSKSMLYDMVMDAHGLAIGLGLAEERAPDPGAMLTLTKGLRSVATKRGWFGTVVDKFSKVKSPSPMKEESSYQKRINEMTPKTVSEKPKGN